MGSGHNHCPNCNSERQYSNKYDAYYCELCNIWLEEKCEDEGCDFCVERPEKPSQIQLTTED
jgi:hypothetical protein